MISSEVKRTLVKSPPELWTELSDPAALARHLGEFGEIRITRSEPEQLVEWESERASGRVMLKPSGWGTKVTLTVEGELPGGPPGRPNAAPDLPEPVAAPESPDLAEPLPPPDLAEPLAAPDLAQPLAPLESPGLAEALEPPESVQANDPSPAAAEIVDSDDRVVEPDQRWDDEREVELVPPPHSAAAIAAEVAGADRLTPLDPRPEPEAHAEAHLEPEPAIAARPAPEARRGFFARLFGRSAPAVEVPVAEPAPRSDPLPPPIAAPAQSVPAPEPAQITATEEQAPEPIAPQEHVPEPIAPEEHVPEPVAAADPLPGRPVAAEPLPGHVEPTAAAEQAQEEIVPAAPAENDPIDLAGELQTAEAQAAEQVKLVLTSVLDRLGSAHHRPFSRS